MSTAHTILVIEDNDEDFAMIERGLDRVELPCHTVRLQRVSDLQPWLTKNPSLSIAFLDLNMPGEQGHAAIEILRRHPKYSDTPLLVLSTSMNAQDVKRSYALGANAYHVKPLETHKFHDIVSDIAAYWFNKAVIPQRVM